MTNNTFRDAVDQLLESKRFRYKQDIAKAMRITKEDLSRYYNGVHSPSLDKSVEIFGRVGFELALVERKL